MNAPFSLIETLFQSTRERLVRRLKQRLTGEQEAEDIVQEVYLRVVERAAAVEIDNLPAYVNRVADNLLNDHTRRPEARRSAVHLPLDDEIVSPQPSPEHVAESSQELDRLYQLISALPAQCRRVFLLKKVDNLSHAEIARELGISPRTVETHIVKALKLLRDGMAER